MAEPLASWEYLDCGAVTTSGSSSCNRDNCIDVHDWCKSVKFIKDVICSPQAWLSVEFTDYKGVPLE